MFSSNRLQITHQIAPIPTCILRQLPNPFIFFHANLALKKNFKTSCVIHLNMRLSFTNLSLFNQKIEMNLKGAKGTFFGFAGFVVFGFWLIF
jgi:hypothetical protein